MIFANVFFNVLYPTCCRHTREHIMVVVFYSNPVLEELGGFDSLTTVGGNVAIIGNSKLNMATDDFSKAALSGVFKLSADRNTLSFNTLSISAGNSQGNDGNGLSLSKIFPGCRGSPTSVVNLNSLLWLGPLLATVKSIPCK